MFHNKFDARHAAYICRDFAVLVSGHIADNSFKLSSVKRSSENGKFWIVDAEFIPNPSARGSQRYTFIVNGDSGEIIDINGRS